MKWTYRSEYVKCGNERCKACPHGPYWYRYAKVKGKLKKEYIGKECAFAGGPAAEPGQVNPWNKIHDVRQATVALACEILGVDRYALDFETVKRIARQKLKDNHPDRGGDNATYCHINSAWTFLKAVQNWK